jgi:hypothetical protein
MYCSVYSRCYATDEYLVQNDVMQPVSRQRICKHVPVETAANTIIVTVGNCVFYSVRA